MPYSTIVKAASSDMIMMGESGQAMPSCVAVNPNTDIYPISMHKIALPMCFRKEFINLPP